MAEGIVIICACSLIITAGLAIISGFLSEFYFSTGGIVAAVVITICVIATTIVCISFAKSYTEEEKSAEATVVKVESQAFESSVKYKVWAKDNNNEVWEASVTSGFYAITHEGDRVVVQYKIIHYWKTTKIEVVQLIREE